MFTPYNHNPCLNISIFHDYFCLYHFCNFKYRFTTVFIIIGTKKRVPEALRNTTTLINGEWSFCYHRQLFAILICNFDAGWPHPPLLAAVIYLKTFTGTDSLVFCLLFMYSVTDTGMWHDWTWARSSIGEQNKVSAVHNLCIITGEIP